jgi:acetyl esterase/lipase
MHIFSIIKNLFMKQFYSVLIVVFLIHVSLKAQNACFSDRYKSRVFSSYVKYGDLKYAEVSQTFPPYLTENLHMNVYMPQGDSISKRPVIIFAHASAFMFSNKDCDVAKAYADTFSRRGYVFASLNYRLGFNPVDGESSMRAAYGAIQDGKAAVRFIKEYADTLGIDTNNIIFAGSSAGGIMALYAAYADKESERPADSYGGLLSPDMGCWDCSGNTFNHSSSIKAAISCWGAVLDVNMIDNANAPPCMLIHGKDDLIVPYGTGHPFQFPLFPESSGSETIAQQASLIGLTHELYPFDITGIDHEFYGSGNGNWLNLIGPNQHWDTVTTLIASYMFEQIQPQTSIITGKTTVYQNELQQSYSVTYHDGYTYCWEVMGGTLISSNANTAIVLWNNSGTGEVKITEISNYLAEGNPQTLSVNILETATGLNDLIMNAKMNIYPNPATSEVRFRFNTHSQLMFKLYNSMGQEIKSVQINPSKFVSIKVSDYAPGIYSCMAWLNNGELFAAEKLIVE